MIVNLIVGICIIALCVGIGFSVYMYQWGVWND